MGAEGGSSSETPKMGRQQFWKEAVFIGGIYIVKLLECGIGGWRIKLENWRREVQDVVVEFEEFGM